MDLQQKITKLSTIKTEDVYEWKKEGLKMQNEIGQSAIELLNLDLNNLDQTQELVQAVKTLLKQRCKEPRIADNSEAGWETVNGYNTHPVADDSDDAKRILKAEKLA